VTYPSKVTTLLLLLLLSLLLLVGLQLMLLPAAVSSNAPCMHLPFPKMRTATRTRHA
jgi:hypothetical protein